jgi:hypothetical protein
MEREQIDLLTDPCDDVLMYHDSAPLSEDPQTTSQAESENAAVVGCAEFRRFYNFRVMALDGLL